MKRKLAVIFTLMVLVVLAPIARADSLTFTLNPPPSLITAGTTISFTGTIAAPGANAGAVSLDGISVLVSPAAPFTLDDNPFFANTPLFLLPGESFSGELFLLTAGPGVTSDIFYEVQASIIYGDAAGAQSSTAFQSGRFMVPEPASMLLLGMGFMGLAGAIRRRAK